MIFAKISVNSFWAHVIDDQKDGRHVAASENKINLVLVRTFVDSTTSALLDANNASGLRINLRYCVLLATVSPDRTKYTAVPLFNQLRCGGSRASVSQGGNWRTRGPAAWPRGGAAAGKSSVPLTGCKKGPLDGGRKS